MFDLDKYMTERQCTLVKQLGSKRYSRLYVLKPDCSGEFVCRVYDHPVPAYEQAMHLRNRQIPRIHRCLNREDGVTIVEEEYIDGVSLAELLETGRPDENQTAAIVAEVCRGLMALHEKGVIHRDVKPENILLTSAGRVVLIDLDAASNYNPEKHRDTSLLGTVGYAAPEQFGFGRSDVRTDIFGLGVMMNIMLTGEHPTQKLATGVLRPVIERCIAVNVDQRYRSAGDLLEAVIGVAGEAGVCPECGFITPGGGCLFCRTASKGDRVAPRAKLWPKLAVAVLCLVIGMTAGLLIPNKSRTDSEWESEPPVISQNLPSEDPTPTPSEDSVPIPSEKGSPEESVPVEPQPIQTEVTLYDRNYALTPAEFQYQGETYFLNAALNVNGEMVPISQERLGLRESNSPDDEYSLSSQMDRIIVPMIWKRNDAGDDVPAEELAPLLENPTVTLYRLQEEGLAPDITALDPYQGIWRGCTNARFYAGSAGWWLVEVKATIEGREYCSHTLIVITNQWP